MHGKQTQQFESHDQGKQSKYNKNTKISNKEEVQYEEDYEQEYEDDVEHEEEKYLMNVKIETPGNTKLNGRRVIS